MSVYKKKVLLLSTHDSHLKGHAWSCMQLYDKTKYEVDLISLYSINNNKSKVIVSNFLLYRVINKLLQSFEDFFIKKSEKYCYSRVFTFPVTANQILRKYKLGNPDIIVLHWYDGFITPRIIKQMYEKTLAKIVFVFTDEFPLGGGCHYPCECIGYETQCKNCPALLNFKNIAEKKLAHKVKLLSRIPKVVIAPSAGIEQALRSAVFKVNTEFIKSFRGYAISNVPSFQESRSKLSLQMDDFVIMFGALNIDEERKGMSYLLKALEILSDKIDRRIIALVVGNTTAPLKKLKDIDYRYMGTVPLEQLYEIYAASNVYISPSIADAGPMMVKFSIACGTPVVAFPVGYALDLIKHKETGYIAKMQDVEDLSDGICYFYKNQRKQKEFRNNCIRLNEDLCNRESVYNEL